MGKPFDQWNALKKKIDECTIDTSLFFHEREVWWCAMGINIGVETDGKNEHFERPVLILRKFNGLMLWVLPLTSKEHPGIHFQSITHSKGVSYACISQLRTISSKRLLRKIGMISDDEFLRVNQRVRGYLQKSDPAFGGVLGGRSH